MNCTECRENFTALGKGLLSAPDRAALQRHLDSCGDCSAELALWQTLFSALDRQEPAPVEMTERFHAALSRLARSSEVLPATSTLQRLFIKIWPAKPVWAFSYSLVLLCSGVAGGQLLPAVMPGMDAPSNQAASPDAGDTGKTALVCPVHSSPTFWLPASQTTLT